MGRCIISGGFDRHILNGEKEMSVLRSKRSIAQTEFENTFEKLYQHSKSQTSKVPKRRKRWICYNIDRIMNELYNEIMELNEGIYLREYTDEEKIEHLRKILILLHSIEKPLFVFWNIQDYEMRKMISWCKLLQSEFDLLINMSGFKKKYRFCVLDRKRIREVDFLRNMSEFHKYVHGKVVNAPCAHDDTSGSLLIKLVDDAFYDVMEANKKIPETNSQFKKRKEHIAHAIKSLYKIQRQTIFYFNLMGYSENVMNEWSNYLTTEIKLLQALQKSDSKRFQDLE